MTTVTKATKDAKFFSSQSNARRALKKVFNCATEVANMYIHMEALEEGGRFWFSEGEVNKAAKPQVETDKITKVELLAQQVRNDVWGLNEERTPAEAVEAVAKLNKTRSEVRNGVRKPIRGKCADVWAALTEVNEKGAAPTITDVRALAEKHGWNINNATIEFYGWRKFYA